MFLKRLQLFFNPVLQERKENYFSIQREHSIPFKQLLMKEIIYRLLMGHGKLILSPCIMSVQYTGGVQYNGGCSVYRGKS